jgi:hypothetical protein
MVWTIGPVIEYEAQSAVITLVGIIMREEMSCDNNAISFLLVVVLRQKKTS